MVFTFFFRFFPLFEKDHVCQFWKLFYLSNERRAVLLSLMEAVERKRKKITTASPLLFISYPHFTLSPQTLNSIQFNAQFSEEEWDESFDIV